MQATSKTVLIADDDEDILNLVRFRLERDGLRVLLARDGQQALQTARDERPDLCVLDVMMPKLSGLEVLAQLRRDPDTAAMPVIMLTARAHEADVTAGFDSGADDYVIKPFSPQELRQRVRAQLSR
ncbi:MAG: response regulator transcription factor [Solirubrobacteraceae bacterium]